MIPNVDVFVARDKGGRSLLHNAVLFGHVPVVKFLVEQHHHLVNTRDNVSHPSQRFLNCGLRITEGPRNGHGGYEIEGSAPPRKGHSPRNGR